MEKVAEILSRSLFQGIEAENLSDLLSCTGYRIAEYQKGQVLLLEQEEIRHIGIVLSGAVDMVLEDLWGGQTLLVRQSQGEMFGETFACSRDNRALATFVAAQDCRVMFIPFYKVMHTCNHACQFHHRLVENMVQIIAEKNRELLRKVDVVSKKTLREKILAYLSIQSQIQQSRYIELPLGRVELARYLCADRSALTRELENMRNDGLIDFHKNTFKIL